MNYLQLCQKVSMYLDLQGEITSVNASGLQQVVVDKVQKAWVDIQRKRTDWSFLYRNTNITISPTGGTQYTIADIGSWDLGSILLNRQPLRYVTYQEFLRMDTTTPVKKPSYFSVNPAGTHLLFPAVTEVSVITACYWCCPQILTTNVDVPVINQCHHYTIVNGALVDLSAFLSNQDIYQQALMDYRQGLGEMMRAYVPSKSITLRPLC
jgi:hypothetical protein